jgi:hypothetical protein
MAENLPNAFDQQSAAKRSSLAGEFLHFLARTKKWWLLPIIIVVLFLGGLMFLGSTAAAPFIYSLF